jgi:hypothetical protein
VHARNLTLGLILTLSAGVFAASCSDDTEDPGGSGAAAGTGAAGGGGGSSGDGGSGGVACGDVQTDPANCGACGHPCAPGQTCEAGVCACGADSASFSADVQPILTTSCAKSLCHSGAMPKAGLDLTAGAAYAELTGSISIACMEDTALVVPGQPSESYIMKKLLGVDLCTGKRMPPAAALPEASIKTIADWICAGALND